MVHVIIQSLVITVTMNVILDIVEIIKMYTKKLILNLCGLNKIKLILVKS